MNKPCCERLKENCIGCDNKVMIDGDCCHAYRAYHQAINDCKDEKMLCKMFGLDDIGDFSDGYHTFNQLYHQRAMLFACIVKQNKEKAWKTHKHENGELCFGGDWFLVTIDTPEGAYGYHYENKYWDLFDCEELEKAKHWDGYTEGDVTRILSL